MARFWGNRCRHGCVPNDTGFTRVSIDFRAMPVSRFDRGFVDTNGNATFLRLGEYYRLGSEAEDEVAGGVRGAKGGDGDDGGTDNDSVNEAEAGRVRAAAAMAAAAAAAGGGIWARR